MQLEVKGLKFWKGEPQSLGLTLFYFLYPAGCLLILGIDRRLTIQALNPWEGDRRTSRVLGGNLRGFKHTTNFLLGLVRILGHMGQKERAGEKPLRS